ncbi:hypothetical protein [Polaromonas sp.]|uniref:hypothetical protein n=1 Tax=Polaromonas sp. TaxID=1869339 RepID=UPI0032664A02
MWINQSGHMYIGDRAQGDRESTPEEIAAWKLSRQPTPSQQAISQIRALEAPFEDDLKKIQRQTIIALLLKESMAMAPQLTKEQVHAYLMAQAGKSGDGYAKLVALEEAVKPYREQIKAGA